MKYDAAVSVDNTKRWYNESSLMRKTKAEAMLNLTQNNLLRLHTLQLNMMYDLICENGVGCGSMGLVCGVADCLKNMKRCGNRMVTLNPFKTTPSNLAGFAVIGKWLKEVSKTLKEENNTYTFEDPFSGSVLNLRKLFVLKLGIFGTKFS